MKYYHFTKFLATLSAGIFGVLVVAILFQFVWTGQALATTGMTNFGGAVIENIPRIRNCPAHTIIFDFRTGSTFGLMLSGTIGSLDRIFDYGNLSAGSMVLGEHSPVVVGGCVGTPGVWYKVYQAYFNSEYGRYQVGTN